MGMTHLKNACLYEHCHSFASAAFFASATQKMQPQTRHMWIYIVTAHLLLQVASEWAFKEFDFTL
jgi:hypothetical protein